MDQINVRSDKSPMTHFPVAGWLAGNGSIPLVKLVDHRRTILLIVISDQRPGYIADPHV